MENKIITESQVKEALDKVLTEQTSKISREQFNNIKVRISDLEKSLNETMIYLRRLDNEIPYSLKRVSNDRMKTMSSYLNGSQRALNQLENKIISYKKSLNTPPPIIKK